MRYATFTMLKSEMILGLLLIACCRTVLAAPEADRLGPTRAKLDALRACLGAQGGVTVAELRSGLLSGWPDSQRGWPGPQAAGPVSPPPPEYIDSLDRDLNACSFASQIKDDSRRQAIIDSVIKDISIKARDCRRNGMGRKVTIHVTTVRGSAPDNGWVVFYKWSCASGFETNEMRIPQLTSPATIDLPPGEYVIRAEKKMPDSHVVTIEPATVIVGLDPIVDLQLLIP